MSVSPSKMAVGGLLLLSMAAAASPPSQPSLGRYTKLWTDSPFTTKPENDAGEANPLEDYALGGISKLDNGYFAILINKKKPSERVTILPGRTDEFEVVNVQWSKESWKETTVTVRAGTKEGVVKFEDKLLELKPPPKAPVKAQPAKKAPTIGNKAAPKAPNPANSNQRRPRPRVVPPKK